VAESQSPYVDFSSQNKKKETGNLAELVLNTESFKKDKEGNITTGDYKPEWLEDFSSYTTRGYKLGRKETNEILYDLRSMCIQNRINREKTADEDYTLTNLMDEYNREISMLTVASSTKEGRNNLLTQLLSSISYMISKNENENENKGKSLWGKLTERK